MQNIVIVGAGGFGREVAWLIERINQQSPSWHILGFVDDALASGQPVGAYEALGGSEWLLAQERPLSVAIAVAASETRAVVASRLKANPNLSYPALADPSVIGSPSVQLGEGCIVCAGTILTIDISLGDFCIVNLDCTVGHDAALSDFCTLYPSVNVSGHVVVGECSELGTGTQVIQGVTVGAHSIVGAGSVVVRPIPDSCTAVGSPCKPIKFR